MHSREPDLIDARAVVDGYIHFGEGEQDIPEYTRPVIVAVVAEVLSIARKEEYGTLSTIVHLCSQPVQETVTRIAEICQSRIDDLSGRLSEESAPAASGRPPTPQYGDPRSASRRDSFQ
jgi:hypothetical protein